MQSAVKKMNRMLEDNKVEGPKGIAFKEVGQVWEWRNSCREHE